MLTRIHSLALAALVGAGVFGFGPAAQAQSFQHIDRLAAQLQAYAEEMHDEVHAHFRLSPQYRHLDHDVAEMERLARHIHEVVHEGGSVAHLRADVNQLDRLYHHTEELIEDLARWGGLDYRAYSHFRQSMRQVGAVLHHLRADLRELDVPHHDHHGGPYPAPVQPPVYQQPPVYPTQPAYRPVGRTGIGIQISPGHGVQFRLFR